MKEAIEKLEAAVDILTGGEDAVDNHTLNAVSNISWVIGYLGAYAASVRRLPAEDTFLSSLAGKRGVDTSLEGIAQGIRCCNCIHLEGLTCLVRHNEMLADDAYRERYCQDFEVSEEVRPHRCRECVNYDPTGHTSCSVGMVHTGDIDTFRLCKRFEPK